MARSHYIYVVRYCGEPEDIVTAFTVKHEMVSWVKRNGGHLMFYADRVRDGSKEPVTMMDLDKECSKEK